MWVAIERSLDDDNNLLLGLRNESSGNHPFYVLIVGFDSTWKRNWNPNRVWTEEHQRLLDEKPDVPCREDLNRALLQEFL